MEQISYHSYPNVTNNFFFHYINIEKFQTHFVQVVLLQMMISNRGHVVCSVVFYSGKYNIWLPSIGIF
jgi:hypothetical protein